MVLPKAVFGRLSEKFHNPVHVGHRHEDATADQRHEHDAAQHGPARVDGLLSESGDGVGPQERVRGDRSAGGAGDSNEVIGYHAV